MAEIRSRRLSAECWKPPTVRALPCALDLHIAVDFYRAVQRLKLSGHLRTQLDRAASSVVLNLGEGAGRRSPADQRRFFDIAYASVKESQTVLYIAVPPTHPVFQLADKLAAHAYRLVERTGS